MHDIEPNILAHDMGCKSATILLSEIKDGNRNMSDRLYSSIDIIDNIGPFGPGMKQYNSGYLTLGEKYILGKFWKSVSESISYPVDDRRMSQLTERTSPVINYFSEVSSAFTYPNYHGRLVLGDRNDKISVVRKTNNMDLYNKILNVMLKFSSI